MSDSATTSPSYSQPQICPELGQAPWALLQQLKLLSHTFAQRGEGICPGSQVRTEVSGPGHMSPGVGGMVCQASLRKLASANEGTVWTQRWCLGIWGG